MTIRNRDGQLFTSSGKRVAGAHEMIGLQIVAKEPAIGIGYDDMMYQPPRAGRDLSREDLLELADYMIAQWDRFKKMVQK